MSSEKYLKDLQVEFSPCWKHGTDPLTMFKPYPFVKFSTVTNLSKDFQKLEPWVVLLNPDLGSEINGAILKSDDYQRLFAEANSTFENVFTHLKSEFSKVLQKFPTRI